MERGDTRKEGSGISEPARTCGRGKTHVAVSSHEVATHGLLSQCELHRSRQSSTKEMLSPVAEEARVSGDISLLCPCIGIRSSGARALVSSTIILRTGRGGGSGGSEMCSCFPGSCIVHDSCQRIRIIHDGWYASQLTPRPALGRTSAGKGGCLKI